MGTSPTGKFFTVATKDHPHAYGDKGIPVVSVGAFRGSSPRVWGQDESFKLPVEKLRIIPTRMGTRITNGRYNNVW